MFSSIFALKILGLFLSPVHAQTISDLKTSYLICHNLDLRRGQFPPVASTLVVSPEVNGTRYYTSWVGVTRKEGSTAFTGRGPQELPDARVTEDGVGIEFPESKNVLGRPVVRDFTKNAQVECHFEKPSEILIPDTIDAVTVGPDFVQSYHFSDMTQVEPWSRNIQSALLKKFVDGMKSRN
ncbi:MAG: hypothetical protein KGP28_03135 [Bdellovibrionales bacterium]|nr:hypothetical protein [Bdellovibrionales bacterium]